MNNITSKLKLNKRILILTTLAVTAFNIVSAQNGQKYSTGGNQLSNGDVLGSTNNQPMVFISNGAEAFRIKPNGSAVFKNDIKLKGGLQITDFAGSGFRLLKVEDDGTLSVLSSNNTQSEVLTGAGIFTPFASMFQKEWDERFNGGSNNFLAQDGHFYPMSSLSQFSWNLKGNEGVDPNEFFLGNKDARDLSIRTNGKERGQLNSSQYENSLFDIFWSLKIHIPFASTLTSWQDFAFKLEYDPISDEKALFVYDSLNAVILNEETNLNVYFKDTVSKTIISIQNNKRIKERIEFNLYPNPVINILNIKTNETVDKIQVLNALNQVVFEGIYSTKEIKINAASIPAAYYTVRIIFTNGLIKHLNFIKL